MAKNNNDSQEESDESQEDDLNEEEQEDPDEDTEEDEKDLEEMDADELKALLKKEISKKNRVVKDNQNLRQRLRENTSSKKPISKSSKSNSNSNSDPNPALLNRARQAVFLQALDDNRIKVQDRQLLWRVIRDDLEFNDDLEIINLDEAIDDARNKHSLLFNRTTGSVDSASRSRRSEAKGDFLRDAFNANGSSRRYKIGGA
jgi:hypothetical protein